jgi:hypothetical protein
MADITILIYQESAGARIEPLSVSHITVFLTERQFTRRKSIVDLFRTVAFNSSQSPAFSNAAQYPRNRFVLMDCILEIAIPNFPFPAIRSSHNETVVTFIRKEDELHSYKS